MADRYTATMVDAEGKTGSTSFAIAELTSANFDALGPLLSEYTTRVEAVCEAEIKRENTTITATNTSAVADGARGNKWVVSVFAALDQEGEGQYYTHEIPCADRTLATYPPGGGSGYLDLTGGAGAALKAAIEDAFVSEEGNPIVVQAITFATRS